MDRRFVIHTPLMWIDKAATFAMADEIGGRSPDRSASRRDPHLLSRRPGASPRLGFRLWRPVRPAGCAPRVLPNGRRHCEARFRSAARREGVLFLALFALTIPAANWLIGHVGTSCADAAGSLRRARRAGLAPGLMAPSGVMLVGVALVLRDLVQRRLGTGPPRWPFCSAAAIGAARAGLAGDRLGYGVPSFRVCRSCGLYASGAPPPGCCGHCFELGWPCCRFNRVPLACFRLARFPRRASRRQILDGAVVDPVRGVAAPPRRAARHHAGIIFRWSMIFSENRFPLFGIML